MNRILLPFVALVAVVAFACGGGATKSAPTRPPEATATTAPAATPSPDASSSAGASSPASAGGSGEEAVGGIFDTIFNSGALTRGTSGIDPGAMPAGDESLKRYLLSQADVPAGYAPLGEFSYRLPDGISKSGGMDMGASMFMSGDPAAADPSGSTILMSMVLKPDDLTQLGDQFSQAKNLSEQDLRDAIAQGTGGLGGMTVTNVEVLDADDLGDGGFGMAMTIDMGELMGAIAGLGGSEPGGDAASLSVMTMRMYFFAKGDYAAGIMRMGFADRLPPDVDDKALAKVVEGRLP